MRPTPPSLIACLAALLCASAAGGAVAAQSGSGVAEGRALAGELGCGACHAGAPSPELARGRAPALGPQAPPLPADFVFTYLADPQRRREGLGATRMPDFRLDEGERVALALFLASDAQGDGDFAAARRRHPDVDAQRGGRIFRALGCAGCHDGVSGAEPIQGPDLSREGARVQETWLTSFLDDPAPVRGRAHPTAPGARMPDFRLTTDEAAALSAWLQGAGRPFAPLPDTPLTPVQSRRTERYLEDRAACLGCHRVDGQGGEIGPSLEGIATRLRPSFVLEMLLDPGRAAPGAPMPHQPMPRREAERLARYIVDRSAAGSPGGAGPSALEAPPSLADPAHPAWSAGAGEPGTPAARGAVLYARHCASCHGVTGEGDGWNAPTLPVPPARHADPVRMGSWVDDALYDGIHAGGWVLDGSPRMPAFGDLLPPEDIRALVAYIRNLCGCEAPDWSRDGRGEGSR